MKNVCIMINYVSGFTQYQHFLQSSERGLFETGYFTTNVYNALQIILVFLNDVPKPSYQRKYQNTRNTRFIKRGKNGAINVKRATFAEAVKTLLTFLVCDTSRSHVNLLLIVVSRYLYSSTWLALVPSTLKKHYHVY